MSQYMASLASPQHNDDHWRMIIRGVVVRRRTNKADEANKPQLARFREEMQMRDADMQIVHGHSIRSTRDDRIVDRMEKTAKIQARKVGMVVPKLNGRLVTNEEMEAYWDAKRAFDVVVFGAGERTIFPAANPPTDYAWAAMMLGLNGWKVAEVKDEDGDGKLYHAASDQWSFVDEEISQLMHNIELEHERNSVSDNDQPGCGASVLDGGPGSGGDRPMARLLEENTDAGQQGADGHEPVGSGPDDPVSDHAFKLLRRLAKTPPSPGVHEPE